MASATSTGGHAIYFSSTGSARWALQARQRDLLPTRYVHVVFTLPHALGPLALQNKAEIYSGPAAMGKLGMYSWCSHL